MTKRIQIQFPHQKARLEQTKKTLPPILIDHIRSFFSFKELHRSRLVCKQWDQCENVHTTLDINLQMRNEPTDKFLPKTEKSWGKVKRAKLYSQEHDTIEYILAHIHRDVVYLDIFICKTHIRFFNKDASYFPKLKELRLGNCHQHCLPEFLNRSPNLTSLRLINSFNPLLSPKIPILYNVEKLRFMCTNFQVATNSLLEKLPNLRDCHLKVHGEVDLSHNQKLEHLTHTCDTQNVDIQKWNLPETMREISLPCLDRNVFYRAVVPLLKRIRTGKLQKLICSTILELKDVNGPGYKDDEIKAIQFFMFPEQILFRTFDDEKMSQKFISLLAKLLMTLRKHHDVPIKIWPLQDDQTQILSASCLGATKLFTKAESLSFYDVGNRTTPCGHFVQRIKVANTHSCDVCGGKFGRKSILYGCRSCNFDLCSRCFIKSGRSFQIKPYPEFNSVYIYNLFQR